MNYLADWGAQGKKKELRDKHVKMAKPLRIISKVMEIDRTSQAFSSDIAITSIHFPV